MATKKSRQGDPRRQSYFLSVTPVDISLTDGTNIPAPSPPRTPVESPHPGGGPLSSHPPSTASTTATDKENEPVNRRDTNRDRADSYQSALSHVSATKTAPPSSPPNARGPGLRKLLSLNNLRSSFSASRSSLLLPRSSTQIDPVTGMKRPSSSSTTSVADSTSKASTTGRSGSSARNWFKRRSSLFLFQNSDGADAKDDGRESKRRREHRPPPRLPQINELGGGQTTDGELGWDDGMFKK